MEKSFGLFFNLKKPKGYVSGEIPVYMRITVDSHCFELSCKRKFLPARWNRQSGRMSGKGEEVKAFNAYLETLHHKVFEVKRNLLELNKPLTAESLQASLLEKEKIEKRMILQIFERHNEQMKALMPQE